MRLGTVGYCLGIVACLATIQSANAQTAPTLRGLTSVRVALDLNAPAGVLSRTDTAALGNHIFDELTRHGWHVLSGNDATSDAPLLFIGILIAESRNRGAPVYGIRWECSLTESVRRVRDGAIMPASTWTSGGQLMLVTDSTEMSAALLNGVAAMAAKFNRERGPLRAAKR